MNWISIKDKLPKSGQVALTFDPRIPNSVFLNTFMDTPERGQHWIDRDGHIFYSGVSHWMSLPEPPRNLTLPAPDKGDSPAENDLSTLIDDLVYGENL